MSAALFLNPNLTIEQAAELSKLHRESVESIFDHFEKNAARVEAECGKKAAIDFRLQMMPLLVQQALSLF